jgi:hypothetical protein
MNLTWPNAVCFQVCPISLALMRDPVVAADGYTYERADIEAWMQKRQGGGQVCVRERGRKRGGWLGAISLFSTC